MGPISKPIQFFILQSNENLEKVLPDFEDAIFRGKNPNDVKDEIFAKYHITDEDFTNSDAQLLIQKVEAMFDRYSNLQIYGL